MIATNETLVALVASLKQGGDELLARLFHDVGLARPRVVWAPQDPDLIDPRHKAYRAHCATQAGAADLPAWDGFLDHLPDYMRKSVILVRIGPDGGPVYEHFGEDVAEQYGEAVLGPLKGRMNDHIEVFYRAVFQVAQERRTPVLTEHEPPRHVFVKAWHRQVEPLIGPDGAVVGFGVMNVAINPLRAGLDAVPDAVFVLDDAQHILYANPGARLLMPKGNGRSKGVGFFEETGIPLPRLDPAAEMLGKGTVEARHSLALRQTLLSDFVVTIRAVMHRAQAVYVVVVRPV